MMAESIAFWALAVAAVAGAAAVVLTRNVFRCALALVVCLLAVAGLYALLSASFLAAVQVLIYVGAITVLIIMAIMLTREVERGNRPGRLAWPALAGAVLFIGLAVWSFLGTDWPLSNASALEDATGELGRLLFSPDGVVLAVEAAALVILATIVGAISIARDK